MWCLNKPSLNNKHSGKATQPYESLKGKKYKSEKTGLLVSYYFEFE